MPLNQELETINLLFFFFNTLKLALLSRKISCISLLTHLRPAFTFLRVAACV